MDCDRNNKEPNLFERICRDAFVVFVQQMLMRSEMVYQVDDHSAGYDARTRYKNSFKCTAANFDTGKNEREACRRQHNTRGKPEHRIEPFPCDVPCKESGQCADTGQQSRQYESRGYDPKIRLFIIAIAIHNLPEGMAVGVAFGSGELSQGIPIAIGIGLQNMPEGLAVAFALIRENYRVGKAYWVAFLTGMIEPLGALLGYGLVRLFSPALPLILAFAAGAMLFVIADEVIPETHSGGNERTATYSLIIGFVVMMVMDIALG
jgi:zinc transporter ZupT